MSGGHFEYQQYRIEDIAVEIGEMIKSNDDQSLDEWGGGEEKTTRPKSSKNSERQHTLCARRQKWRSVSIGWLAVMTAKIHSCADGERKSVLIGTTTSPCAGEIETTMKTKLKSNSPLDAAARSHLRAWRSTVERFVEYQPECSDHGGRLTVALPCHTMTEAIDHCIRWREEGARGTFKVTTRRKEVEEIILFENESSAGTDASEKTL